MHGASIKAFFLDACTLTRATEITISLLFAAADQNKSAVDLAFFHRSMLRLLTRLELFSLFTLWVSDGLSKR